MKGNIEIIGGISVKSPISLGLIFIMMAGFLYTLERCFSLLSTSLVKAGFFSGQMTGEVPQVEFSGFFSNIFVTVFLITGVILIILGYMKNTNT